MSGSELLLLRPVNKQHSSDFELNKHKVTQSKGNLPTVLTLHVQKCVLGFQSSRSVLWTTQPLSQVVCGHKQLALSFHTFIRRSVQGFVLWVSACSFLHVILCKKLSRSRRIHRNTRSWSPGFSEHLGLGNPVFWKLYLPILAWSWLHHSLDNLSIRIILCALSLLATQY